MSTFTHALLQMSKSLLTPNKKGLRILLVWLRETNAFPKKEKSKDE